MVPILLLHILLALPPADLTPDARRTAIAEIASIWSPLGVVVVADSDRPPSDGAVRLRVSVERRPTSLGSWSSGPLASVQFDRAGIPVPTITLYLSTLVEMIDRANLPGSGGDSSPVILRERAVGRAVGRVLAHELGHVLLRSRWHESSGLMRPTHRTADLVGPERQLFRLTPADADRLAAVASIGAQELVDVECTGAEQ